MHNFQDIRAINGRVCRELVIPIEDRKRGYTTFGTENLPDFYWTLADFDHMGIHMILIIE